MKAMFDALGVSWSNAEPYFNEKYAKLAGEKLRDMCSGKVTEEEAAAAFAQWATDTAKGGAGSILPVGPDMIQAGMIAKGLKSNTCEVLPPAVARPPDRTEAVLAVRLLLNIPVLPSSLHSKHKESWGKSYEDSNRSESRPVAPLPAISAIKSGLRVSAASPIGSNA